MKKWLSLFVLSAICVLTTACGVKGALYFPEQTQQQTTQQ
ncbi:TPA: lipoprotein [Pasteurella multocida]|nr:lipoprotein [Pasteurella multocida]